MYYKTFLSIEVKMVTVDELEKYRFSLCFLQFREDNFPGRGGYKGDYFTFYREQEIS